MNRYDKLLFVGKSNTQLSAMAEAIMQDRFRLEDILIESKGLVVLFEEPVNPKAEAILVSHKLTMKEHKSRPFGPDDFDERTLILTMSKKQCEDIQNEYPQAINVFSLSAYIGTDEELDDPYGGALSDYGQCFDKLEVMIDALAQKLKEEDEEHVKGNRTGSSADTAQGGSDTQEGYGSEGLPDDNRRDSETDVL